VTAPLNANAVIAIVSCSKFAPDHEWPRRQHGDRPDQQATQHRMPGQDDDAHQRIQDMAYIDQQAAARRNRAQRDRHEQRQHLQGEQGAEAEIDMAPALWPRRRDDRLNLHEYRGLGHTRAAFGHGQRKATGLALTGHAIAHPTLQ